MASCLAPHQQYVPAVTSDTQASHAKGAGEGSVRQQGKADGRAAHYTEQHVGRSDEPSSYATNHYADRA